VHENGDGDVVTGLNYQDKKSRPLLINSMENEILPKDTENGPKDAVLLLEDCV